MFAGMEARFAAAARHSFGWCGCCGSRFRRRWFTLAMTGIVAVSVFNPFRACCCRNCPSISVLWSSPVPSCHDGIAASGRFLHDADQRPYEGVWAKAAIQDLTDPDHVELNTPRAKVMMEDKKGTVTMDARTGFFDSKQYLVLDLRKDIFLQSSTGWREARLSQAYIDINKGTVISDEHVDVKLLNGTPHLSTGSGFSNSGEVVRFEGNVVMHLDNLGAPGRSASRRLLCHLPPTLLRDPETRSVPGKTANSK